MSLGPDTLHVASEQRHHDRLTVRAGHPTGYFPRTDSLDLPRKPFAGASPACDLIRNQNVHLTLLSMADARQFTGRLRIVALVLFCAWSPTDSGVRAEPEGRSKKLPWDR